MALSPAPTPSVKPSITAPTTAPVPAPALPLKFKICTCGLPPSETYFHPLILCAAKSRCKTRIFHLRCVGLTVQQRALMNSRTWFCADCRPEPHSDYRVGQVRYGRQEEQWMQRVCVCDVAPYVRDGPMVSCARKGCRVGVWHWVCAGFPGQEDSWVCGECRVDDALGESGLEGRGDVGDVRGSSMEARGNVLPGGTWQEDGHQEQAPKENDSREEETQRNEDQPKESPREETRQHDTPHEEPQEEDTTSSPPPSKRQKTSPNNSSPAPVITKTNDPPAQLQPTSTTATPPPPLSLPPSPSPQPEYCLCGTPAVDSMIGCDGKACQREWFHYECVGLTVATVPRGKWFCEECKGEEEEEVVRNKSEKKAASWKRRR